MKYSRFEALLLGAGAITVLGNILFILPEAREIREVAGQIMLLAVLAGAVHWGRKGGLIAAIAASVLYAVTLVPLANSVGGVDTGLISLLAVRVLSYGVVGVLGGELCGRLKYVFTRLEHSESIDEWSGVYNQRWLARLLDDALGQHTRYATPFSVVTLRIDTSMLQGLRPARLKKIIHSVANHIRNDLRLVDEVGRLEDGTFLILLPHTPGAGGAIVADRLARGVSDTLGATESAISTDVVAAPESLEAVVALRATLGEATPKLMR